MRLLAIIFALLIGLSTGMDMLVAGNFTGSGFNESCLEVPGANVTGNNSSWEITWKDDLYGSERPHL
jgi:hypothetical protein